MVIMIFVNIIISHSLCYHSVQTENRLPSKHDVVSLMGSQPAGVKKTNSDKNLKSRMFTHLSHIFLERFPKKLAQWQSFRQCDGTTIPIQIVPNYVSVCINLSIPSINPAIHIFKHQQAISLRSAGPMLSRLRASLVFCVMFPLQSSLICADNRLLC